jgi:cell fate regulator YaaT (PSP1 superfamily)
MTEVVGLRLHAGQENGYFYANGINALTGQYMVVDTPNGHELGIVTIPNKKIDIKTVRLPFRENKMYSILRVASIEDLKIIENNKELEKQAFDTCTEKINERGLKMNLVDVECTFSNSKLLFYFTAENRVDFRELVRDLASIFRTRIELRQIGVRDKAKKLGGLGPCGREFCCKSYQNDFAPVSIKMAKEQGLSLNPIKISGTCGRLMCCLDHEYTTYQELYKITPKVGSVVSFGKNETGMVTDANLLTGKIKIEPSANKEVPVILQRDEVKVIKDVQPKYNKDDVVIDK